MTHAKGLPYFLHSCGNLSAILDDLIDDVRIDAKHSYEDAILPVQDFQARYGRRIGVLGGIDLNILAGGTPEQVRAAAQLVLDAAPSRFLLAADSSPRDCRSSADCSPLCRSAAYL
jgi:uroporphyrinogen decarboxylase